MAIKAPSFHHTCMFRTTTPSVDVPNGGVVTGNRVRRSIFPLHTTIWVLTKHYTITFFPVLVASFKALLLTT